MARGDGNEPVLIATRRFGRSKEGREEGRKAADTLTRWGTWQPFAKRPLTDINK